MGRKHHTERWNSVECGPVGSSVQADLIIGALAAKQRGVVSRGQLLDRGVGAGAIDHRLALGRLHRIRRGVYLVGHSVPPRLAHETAALLSCGSGAVLSHRTAGRMSCLVARPGGLGEIDVSIPGRDPGRKPGICVHRVRALDERDVRRFEGLPITAPARTLLDLAGVASTREIERAIEEAEVRRLVRRHELTALLTRSGQTRGTAVLRRLLAADRAPALTRSEAEERLLALVKAAQLTPPEVNIRLGRHEVDFLWREEGLVVEADGFRFHSSRLAFERDRLRDAELQSHGWRVIRVTWRQIAHQPEAVVARIATALTTRSRVR
jgi:very-short-patch-repair endonuclease